MYIKNVSDVYKKCTMFMGKHRHQMTVFENVIIFQNNVKHAQNISCVNKKN